MGDVVIIIDEPKTKPMTAAPEAGQIVRVRRRLCFAEDVVSAEVGDDSTLVRISRPDFGTHGQLLAPLRKKEVDPGWITTNAEPSSSPDRCSVESDPLFARPETGDQAADGPDKVGNGPAAGGREDGGPPKVYQSTSTIERERSFSI